MNENDLLSYLNIGLPEDVLRMKLHGDFDGAVRLIDRKLSDPALPDPLRYCLMAEREMILRMPSIILLPAKMHSKRSGPGSRTLRKTNLTTTSPSGSSAGSM